MKTTTHAEEEKKEGGVTDLLKMGVEMVGLKGAAIAFGVAAVGAILALAMLLVALLTYLGGGVTMALAFAAGLMMAVAVAGVVGYKLIPRSPLPEKTVTEVKHQAE